MNLHRLSAAVVAAILFLGVVQSAPAQTVLVEAESFKDPGGWVLDTQFIEIELCHGSLRAAVTATGRLSNATAEKEGLELILFSATGICPARLGGFGLFVRRACRYEPNRGNGRLGPTNNLSRSTFCICHVALTYFFTDGDDNAFPTNHGTQT